MRGLVEVFGRVLKGGGFESKCEKKLDDSVGWVESKVWNHAGWRTIGTYIKV